MYIKVIFMAKTDFFSEIKRFKNKIFDKTYQNNFPRINIFVSEQNSRKLLSNFYASTKDWWRHI